MLISQHLEPYMEQLTGSKLRKEYKAVYCHSVYSTDHIYTEHIMQNARLDELQAGIKISGRKISNLRNADDTTLMKENKEEQETLLIRVKEESENDDLKLNIKKKKT